MERELAALVWRREGRANTVSSPKTIDLPFEIDHIIAMKHRGLTRAGDLCLACFACNNHKGTNISGIRHENEERSFPCSIRVA